MFFKSGTALDQLSFSSSFIHSPHFHNTHSFFTTRQFLESYSQPIGIANSNTRRRALIGALG